MILGVALLVAGCSASSEEPTNNSASEAREAVDEIAAKQRMVTSALSDVLVSLDNERGSTVDMAKRASLDSLRERLDEMSRRIMRSMVSKTGTPKVLDLADGIVETARAFNSAAPSKLENQLALFVLECPAPPTEQRQPAPTYEGKIVDILVELDVVLGSHLPGSSVRAVLDPLREDIKKRWLAHLGENATTSTPANYERVMAALLKAEAATNDDFLSELQTTLTTFAGTL